MSEHSRSTSYKAPSPSVEVFLPERDARPQMPAHLLPIASDLHELVYQRDKYLDNNLIFHGFEHELTRVQSQLEAILSVREKAQFFRNEPTMQSIHLKTITGFGDWGVVDIIKNMANAVIFQHKTDTNEQIPKKVFHLDKLKSSRRDGLPLKVNTAASYFSCNQTLKGIFKDSFGQPVSMGLRMEGLLDLRGIDDEKIGQELLTNLKSREASWQMSKTLRRYLQQQMEDQQAPLYPTNASVFIYRGKPALPNQPDEEIELRHITGELTFAIPEYA